jgi:hypothetical protein
MSNDKITAVRIDFAHSIATIKPHLEYDININLEIMDIMNKLKHDSNKDVVDAADHSDY